MHIDRLTVSLVCLENSSEARVYLNMIASILRHWQHPHHEKRVLKMVVEIIG